MQNAPCCAEDNLISLFFPLIYGGFGPELRLECCLVYAIRALSCCFVWKPDDLAKFEMVKLCDTLRIKLCATPFYLSTSNLGLSCYA